MVGSNSYLFTPPLKHVAGRSSPAALRRRLIVMFARGQSRIIDAASHLRPTSASGWNLGRNTHW